MTSPNHLMSVALQEPESSAASELESPAVYLTAPAFSWIQVGALLLSGLALFLAGTFNEAPRNKLRGMFKFTKSSTRRAVA